MSIATFVRRHVYHHVGDKPFSIRDCLIYGSRNTVDQVFHRLVKQGIIVRLAQGIYIKSTAPKPTIYEIAKTKATAFGKTIATHGMEALGILTSRGYYEKDWLQNSERFTNKLEIVFAINGHTSSFKIKDIVVKFIGTSLRRMKLRDHPVGLLIRALDHLGKEIVDRQIVADTVGVFGRLENETLRPSVHLMPAWMQKIISLPVRWPYPLSHRMLDS